MAPHCNHRILFSGVGLFALAGFIVLPQIEKFQVIPCRVFFRLTDQFGLDARAMNVFIFRMEP
jgi:hypothetical protein